MSNESYVPISRAIEQVSEDKDKKPNTYVPISESFRKVEEDEGNRGDVKVEGTLGSNLFSALETLDKPRGAIVGGITAALEGEDISEGIEEGFEERPLFQSYLKEKFKGVREDPEGSPILTTALDVMEQPIKGWEQMQFMKQVREVDPKTGKLKELPKDKDMTATERDEMLAAVGGFGLDVAADPLTYMGGVVFKSGKWLVDKTPTSVKENLVSIKETIKASEPWSYIDDAWSLFSTKHELSNHPEFAALEEEFKNLTATARHVALEDSAALQERIQLLSMELRIKPQELNSIIGEAVEKKGIDNVKDISKSIRSNPEIADIVTELHVKNSQQLLKETSVGIHTKPLESFTMDSDVGLAYLNHAIHPKVRKKINKENEKAYRKMSDSERAEKFHSSMLRRKEAWAGLSIKDVNDLAKKGELPGYEGTKFKEGFFIDDPAIAQGLRDYKHHRTVAAAELINGAKGLGFSPKQIKEKAIEAGAKVEKDGSISINKALHYLQEVDPSNWSHMSISNNKYTRDHIFPEEVTKHLDRHVNAAHKIINDPAHLEKFVAKTWDPVTNWWKAWTLSVFPAYHVRNKVGNIWNNHVAGVKTKSYLEAKKVQTKGVEGKLVNTKYTYKEVKDLSNSLGVTGRGMFTADIETGIINELGESKWLTLGTNSKAIAIGKKYGELLEDNSRLANFIDGLQKGMKPAEAAKRTKQTLFDYGDVTEFEKKVMKRALPFYTWSRKNIPFQIRGMIDQPGKYKAIDTLRQNIEESTKEAEPSEKYLAEYYLVNYPIRLRYNTKEKSAEYFMLGGWWPAADVWKVASKPTSLFKDLLHPILKMGLESELGAGEKDFLKDVTTGQEYHHDVPSQFMGAEIDEATKHMMKNMRVFNTIDEFMQGVSTSEWGKDLFKSLDVKLDPKKGTYPVDKIGKVFQQPHKTLESALYGFMTGMRVYTNFYNQQMINQSYKEMEAEREVDKTINKLMSSQLLSKPELKEATQTQMDKLGLKP
jgi:hypothetical protein